MLASDIDKVEISNDIAMVSVLGVASGSKHSIQRNRTCS